MNCHFKFVSLILIFNTTVTTVLATNMGHSQPVAPIISDSLKNQLEKLEAQFQAKIQKLDTLEKEVKNLTKSSDNKSTLITWPIITLIFGVVFAWPIFRLLYIVGTKLTKVDTIKYNSIELSSSDLDSIIVDREILKIGISIAAVDRDFHKNENELLAHRANDMADHLSKLSKDAKIRVLYASVNMASADGTIKKDEYEVLKWKAKEFGLLVEFINAIDNFISKGIVLESVVQSEHETLKATLFVMQ